MTTPPVRGPYVEFQQVEEPKLEITVNGKEYEIIKVRRRVGGSKADWKELDLDKLTRPEKEALVNAAKKSCKVFDMLDETAPTDDLKSAHTLTLRFFQEYEHGPSLLNQTLGKKFDRFAWKPKLNTLKEVSYKASEDSKEKTYQLHLERYSPQDQEKIHKLTKPLTQHVSHLANAQHKNPHTRSLKRKGSTAALQSAVKDVGSQDNKCAALSIAAIQQEAGDRRSLSEIAQQLVNNSLYLIGSQDEFVTPGHTSQSALHASITEYNRNREVADQIAITDDPTQLRLNYLDKMRSTSGQMLDYPFFLTIKKPTIILEIDPSSRQYKIKALANPAGTTGPALTPTSSLADFNQYNIVLYVNQNHYQAVLPKEEHLAALQQIINSYTSQLLAQMKAAIPIGQSTINRSQINNIISSVANVMNFNPSLKDPIILALEASGLLTQDNIRHLRSQTSDFITVLEQLLIPKLSVVQ